MTRDRPVGYPPSRKRGLSVVQHRVIVGEQCVDLLAEDPVIVEPKVANALSNGVLRQCRNDWPATGKPCAR